MIKIVYHCYLVGDWKNIVQQQLMRLKRSKLYDNADEIYVTINLVSDSQETEFNEITKEYPKLKKEFYINNPAEYPGIKKVREIGTSEETKVFYFHSKGVSNTYSRYNLKDISEEKIKNILAWRECLEYFLIDKWEECVEKLNEFDNVGVTCNGGWYWGNFWWTQTKHLIKTQEVGQCDRWYYEAWLNYAIDAKNYEWFKFTYNPYITYLHPDWYKGLNKYKNDKIILKKALYGSLPFEIDEGYSGSELNVVADVSEIVKKLLIDTDNLELNVPINNQTLGIDPIQGTRKFLVLEISPESNLDEIYKIGAHEGSTINFKF